MNPPVLIALLLITFVIIVIIINYNSKKAKVKRKLNNALVKRIADFSNGEVAKIIGKVQSVDNPLSSPLSNRKCSYYYVHVEQKVSSGKSSSWNTLIELEVSSKFVIREGDKHAFIDDHKLQSYIVQDKEYSSGFMEDATETLEKFLNAHGHDSENFLGLNKTIRYREGILEEGEEIAILGKGEWKDAIQFQLPDSLGKVLVISSLGNEPIYMSDDPDTVINRYDN